MTYGIVALFPLMVFPFVFFVLFFGGGPSFLHLDNLSVQISVIIE